MLGSSRNWASAGADLADFHHVLAPDLRNHGASPHADEMNYEAMAADVLAWLDDEGIGEANVLGHSMEARSRCCWLAGFPRGSRAWWWSTLPRATISGPRTGRRLRR
jgi:hypothetical protein